MALGDRGVPCRLAWQPLKFYILAGQSNMQGLGNVLFCGVSGSHFRLR